MKDFFYKYILLVSFLLLFTHCSEPGCMDVIACNYNSEATEDDGTCEIPLENPIEIIYIDDYVSGTVGEDLISHIYVRNSSCETMTDLIVRKIFTTVPDVTVYFCFNDICFPSTTITAPNPLTLETFETDDYFKGYLNSDISGVFEVKYRFYLQGQPSQSVEVSVTYEVN